MSADLIKYTEAAMALLDGKIAEVVYLPPDVRKTKTRINAYGHATNTPLTAKEALDRIIAADPLGFLIAVMNGQPVMTFDVVDKKIAPKATGAKTKKKFKPLSLGEVDGVEIIAQVHVPTIDDRKEVAKFLVPYVTEKRKKKGEIGPDDPEEAEFERILAQRAQQARDEAGDDNE
jgi:hypothetical protein